MLQISDIMGGDAVFAYLQAALEQQSTLLVAEQRTGKTHVLEKFKAIAPTNWVVIKRDIGAIRSAHEFVPYVMADLSRTWRSKPTSQIGYTRRPPCPRPGFKVQSPHPHPASNAAFPPAAVVLMVMVCSAQKRYR